MLRTIMLAWLLLCAPFALADGINVNSATLEQLDVLPGIGPSKAQSIIDYREANGAFSNVEQLINVSGIGPATMDKIRSLVEINGGNPDLPKLEAKETGTQQKPPSGALININTASAQALEGLKGIGPTLSKAIVADRNAVGPYNSCSDLTRVKGIGPATLANIADDCTVADAE